MISPGTPGQKTVYTTAYCSLSSGIMIGVTQRLAQATVRKTTPALPPPIAEALAPMDAPAEAILPDAEANTEGPDWHTPEDDKARRMVFLITFAPVLAETALVAEQPLKTLDGLTREDIRDAVLDAIANPVLGNLRGGRPRTNALEVTKLVVFLEEPRHFHCAIKLTDQTRFLPLKKALRQRAGLASHWSTSHAQWWSAVRYGTFTTERKQTVDSSPLAWAASGEPLNLYEESQEPFQAAAFMGQAGGRRDASSGAACQREAEDVHQVGLRGPGDRQALGHARCRLGPHAAEGVFGARGWRP